MAALWLLCGSCVVTLWLLCALCVVAVQVLLVAVAVWLMCSSGVVEKAYDPFRPFFSLAMRTRIS